MMASMGQPFSPHPGGMQQHPGAPPAHPMAPGMAHNPSQPGAQPGGMPHQLVGHMGVSAPGGQMNPSALMGGMPPGAGGPNAHAMQHLNPTQAQMFQAQHLNPMAFNNQAFQQQMQQQRLQQLQHQQQRQLMAQQAAYGNMSGMPMGLPMQQLSAQAQMAMRGRLPGQPPNAHAHAMLAHHMALQQQQANNQLAQQGGNPNQSPMNPQQLQGLQQAHIAALQAQQQAAQVQAQQAQAQQAQQAQAQQQQQQPGQPQQQTAQQPSNQAGPGGNVPQQSQGQGQGQGPNQQPNPQLQQQQPQAALQHVQQHALQQAQLAQAQAQHNQAVAASLMQQQKHREGMKGHCLLKLLQFNEHLSGFPGSTGKDDLSYWNDFVHRFFSPRGIFRHAVHTADGDDQAEKQYEITYPALPRYFHTHFDSGVKHMQLVTDKGTTDKPLPGDCHLIENSKASFVYWFEGGSHLVATGTLRAQFDAEQKFELFEFITTGHEEYISRRLVIEAAKPAHNWVKEWHRVNTQDNKQSPEMSKKGKARALKSPQNAPPDLDLPHSVVKQSLGVTEAVFQFLELVEIMGHMNPLFGFCHNHPGLKPYEALDQYVNLINASTGNAINGPPMGQLGAGPRTPAFGQFPVGASPAHVHQMLPASPHIGSPAPGTMQAPGMQLQASQQGTSSSGPSANTSPSQSNKRRRASAIKNEDETSGTASAASGPQLNGIQGKGKPPTPRMTKKVKGNPA